MKRTNVGLVFGTIFLFSVSVYAGEYNFYEQADKKGCASIITEREQGKCADVQAAKDKACGVPVECEVSKQERLIGTYKEMKDRLERGQVADADKDRLKDTVNTLKQQLDGNKEAARRGISVAETCVRSREDVQKWFAETGIPLTERTRDDALRQRKDLLDKLADTQRKQADAKAKRDAKPNDSSAQSDYDRAVDDMRNAEKMLEQFNNKFGKDIERYAAKLIAQYQEERTSHDRPLNEARNRVDNCKKVENLSY